MTFQRHRSRLTLGGWRRHIDRRLASTTKRQRGARTLWLPLCAQCAAAISWLRQRAIVPGLLRVAAAGKAARRHDGERVCAARGPTLAVSAYLGNGGESGHGDRDSWVECWRGRRTMGGEEHCGRSHTPERTKRAVGRQPTRAGRPRRSAAKQKRQPMRVIYKAKLYRIQSGNPSERVPPQKAPADLHIWLIQIMISQLRRMPIEGRNNRDIQHEPCLDPDKCQIGS